MGAKMPGTIPRTRRQAMHGMVSQMRRTVAAWDKDSVAKAWHTSFLSSSLLRINALIHAETDPLPAPLKE